MARAVNSGCMYPTSFVGCHAGDYESYDDFKDFFYPVIQAYHKGFDVENGPSGARRAGDARGPARCTMRAASTQQARSG